MVEARPGTAPFERLFSPLRVGPMTVPNRICETTNTIGAAQIPGFVDEPFIAHHLAKAAGGTGWIGGETFLLDSPLPSEAADEFFPGTGAIRIPLYRMPGFVESVKKFRDAVAETGAVVVCQLTHLNFTLAASSLPIAEAYDWIPHELNDDEIGFVIGTYADAAEVFAKAGVDGIEIHCAHEALPQTFLSPALNHRSDEWGGGARSRTKFLRSVLRAVKERVGDSLAIGIRVNGCESREGGYDAAELREMLGYVADTGALDYVNVDVGHSWGHPSYVQSSHVAHAAHRDIARDLKRALGSVPVLYSGRVVGPEIAEELLASECCDLVGMTRAGIADPEFANKARSGRTQEIRRCIGCNRCIGNSIRSDTPDMFRKPVCSVNPEVGNESFYAATWKPANPRRRFVVAGGGPAGCEAARVAAMRGHEVILIERCDSLGGQLNLAAASPGREAYRDFIDFQARQLEANGVDVRLGSEIGAEALLELGAEAIACATGSLPRSPDTPGIDAPHVVQGWDVLSGRARVGPRVAVVSQEDAFQTPVIAERLASEGHQVEIFHKWTAIGTQIDRYSIGAVMQRLAANEVLVHTGLRLARVEAHLLEFKSAFDGRSHVFEGFDSVVLAYGSVPDVALYRELSSHPTAPRLFLVGSAWVPRLLAEATQHGARVGMEI